MTIYERIKFLREKLNMSQQELALKVGYQDKSAVSKVERGERDITQTMVTKYAKALNTTPSYLMGWEEEISPEQNELSEGEKIWLSLYNRLSEEAREAIITTASALEQLPAESQKIFLSMLRGALGSQA